MKTAPVGIVDFEERQLRNHSTKVLRTADKLGFVGIARDGTRVCYLVSAKFWRAGVLDGKGFCKITRYGKIVACVVPQTVWEIGMSFVGCFTPAARRKLPAIARAAAARDARGASK